MVSVVNELTGVSYFDNMAGNAREAESALVQVVVQARQVKIVCPRGMSL